MIRDILRLTQSVAGIDTGRNWLFFIVRSLIGRRKFLHLAHWTHNSAEESHLLRRLSIIPAVYTELMKSFHRENAFGETKNIFLPLLLSEMMSFYRTLNLSMKDDMERLMEFRKAFDEKGAGKFCNREYIIQNHTSCHFIVTRCVYHDYFTEISLPELTKIFCEVDWLFYARTFPSLRFHRGNSPENTIAFGKTFCNFFIERTDKTTFL